MGNSINSQIKNLEEAVKILADQLRNTQVDDIPRLRAILHELQVTVAEITDKKRKTNG